MSWQLLTAISVIGLSLSVILQRVLIHKDKIDPFAYAVLFQTLVALVISFFVAVYGFSLPNISTVIIPAVLCIVLYGTGHIVYAKTLQQVEASTFAVLFATHAVWIMIIGIVLFHEHLTILEIIGSLLIFASVVFVTRSHHSFALNKGTLLGLLTGVLFGVAITCWSYVGRHTDTLSWAAVSFAGAAVVALLIRPAVIGRMKPLLAQTILPKLLVLGVFYAIGSVAMLAAYKAGDFSIVSPLRQTGIVLTVLLALALLRQERSDIIRKILAAALCAIGVAIIIA